jgi:hypothetical protein
MKKVGMFLNTFDHFFLPKSTITMQIKSQYNSIAIQKNSNTFHLAGFEPTLFCLIFADADHYTTTPRQIN